MCVEAIQRRFIDFLRNSVFKKTKGMFGRAAVFIFLRLQKETKGSRDVNRAPALLCVSKQITCKTTL
jgi:hypothetical protein